MSDANAEGKVGAEVESSVEGRVIRVDAKVCWVRLDDGSLLKCTIRGRLFRDEMVAKHPVSVGDRVRVSPSAKDEGVVEAVCARRNKLSRPAVDTAHRKEQVIVANVDYLAIVAAAARPKLRLGLIDRYLIVARRQDITPIIVVNKVDLVDPVTIRTSLSLYEDLGLPVCYTSATEGEGVDRLRTLIESKITVFSGHSGVGKSTLLNAIVPDLDLRTQQVSRKSGRGTHTTTQVTLYELDGGGCLIDTPGIRTMGLWRVEPEEVNDFFDEISVHAPNCRFQDCAHNTEPDCAVKAAVEAGVVDVRRYESYRRIWDAVTEEKLEQRGW